MWSHAQDEIFRILDLIATELENYADKRVNNARVEQVHARVEQLEQQVQQVREVQQVHGQQIARQALTSAYPTVPAPTPPSDLPNSLVLPPPASGHPAPDLVGAWAPPASGAASGAASAAASAAASDAASDAASGDCAPRAALGELTAAELSTRGATNGSRPAT